MLHQIGSALQPRPRYRDLTLRQHSGIRQNGVAELLASMEPSGGGSAEDPVFRFFGGDADAADWTTHDYPATPVACARQAVGVQPTYNDGSPCLGDDDDSVLFHNSDYYQAPNSTFGQVTTEDFALEALGHLSDIALTGTIATTRDLGVGWFFYQSTIKFKLRVQDAGANATVESGALAPGWYYVLVLVDRSGFAQFYVNGVASGAAVDVSGVTLTIDSGIPLNMGGRATALPFTGNLAYLAMWKKVAWLTSHLNPDTAAERFSLVSGAWPQIAKGTADPSIKTRAYVKYLTKVESGVTRLYPVGGEWLELGQRIDGNGETVTGYNVEPQDENTFTRSEDFNHVDWTKTRCTLDNNGAVAPDGVQTADGIIGTIANNSHFVEQNGGAAAAEDILSVWAKKGNKDWLFLSSLANPNTHSYFNLDTCTPGTLGPGATAAYMEDWGDDWCRCILVYPGAAVHPHQIGPADDDNDSTFVGDGLTVNTWIWGAGHSDEGLGYPTSYIYTTAAGATRLKDQLRTVADDGNLGGVGSELRGTIEFDFLVPNMDRTVTTYFFNISDGGAAADMIEIKLNSADQIEVKMTATAGLNGDVTSTTTVTDGIRHRCRLTWKESDLRLYIDGLLEARDTACDVPDNLDRINIGMDAGGSAQLSGLISNLKVWKRDKKAA